MAKRVLIGISGGVDSSVAAYLLKKDGFEVIGLTLHMYNCSNLGEKSCCRASDKIMVKKVCEQLGIKHLDLHVEDEFKKAIVGRFADEYLHGRTPNPCVICNRDIKFKYLTKMAEELGCDNIATGHYSRIVDNCGVSSLAKGLDPKKDQSYFLSMIPREYLKKIIFPIGDMTKEAIKEIAEKLDLPTKSKSESQDLCFAPDGDHFTFINNNYRDRLPGKGYFVDMSGKRIGTHNGIHCFTVGMRRKIGLSFGKRKYVVRIDPKNNDVIIGDLEDLNSNRMIISNINWLSDKYHSDRLLIRVRYNYTGDYGFVHDLGGGKSVAIFDEPQMGIAPGQLSVFYHNDIVVGAGWIEN